MRREADLRGYQEWMAGKAEELKYIALWAEPGLGKTAASLTAMVRLMRQGVAKRWLIVAPLLVAETTWPDEIAEWEHTVGLHYSVITGTAAQRKIAAASRAQVHIINRENLMWLYHLHDGKLPYDGLIYDEASRLKEGKVKTKPPIAKIQAEIQTIWADIVAEESKPDKNPNLDDESNDLIGGTVAQCRIIAALKAKIDTCQDRLIPRITEYGVINKLRASLKSAILLTGTPSPNGIVDLWGPIYILDRGKRLHTSKYQFLSHWFERNQYSFKVTPHKTALVEITDRLKDIAFSLRTEDYLTLPDVIHNIVRVKLSAPIMKMYKDFEREFVLEEHDIEAVNSGVLAGKLLQISNGACYRGPEKEVIPIHNYKVEALEMIVAESGDSPVLVAYEFQFDLDRIKAKFPHAVVLNQEADVVKKWNAGKIKLLITHPASAAHGLNLQHGGHICVWFGLTWSLELYQQFNKRLHRSGQKNNVIIHHIVAEDTFDEVQLAALTSKGATQDSVTAAVRINV